MNMRHRIAATLTTLTAATTLSLAATGTASAQPLLLQPPDINNVLDPDALVGHGSSVSIGISVIDLLDVVDDVLDTDIDVGIEHDIEDDDGVYYQESGGYAGPWADAGPQGS